VDDDDGESVGVKEEGEDTDNGLLGLPTGKLNGLLPLPPTPPLNPAPSTAGGAYISPNCLTSPDKVSAPRRRRTLSSWEWVVWRDVWRDVRRDVGDGERGGYELEWKKGREGGG